MFHIISGILILSGGITAITLGFVNEESWRIPWGSIGALCGIVVIILKYHIKDKDDGGN